MPGLVCGDGYCNSGAECAEMSSQTCKRFKEDDLDKKKLKNYDEPTCSKGVCEACQTMTEYKCAFKRGMREPCKEKGCARGRRCVDVEEEVCVVRPGKRFRIERAHGSLTALCLSFQMRRSTSTGQRRTIPRRSRRSSDASQPSCCPSLDASSRRSA